MALLCAYLEKIGAGIRTCQSRLQEAHPLPILSWGSISDFRISDVRQAGAHYFALCMHGLRTAGRVSPPLRLATGRNNSCGQVTTLPRARAWCAGNQRCCRHGGRRDGRWSRRGGGSTRRAPSATGLYQLILIRLLYNLGYPGLSWVIPKHGLSWDILGYLGISRLGVYPMITWGNPT